MRRAARVDENQKEIVTALRKIGAKVEPMHAMGRGFPDLLVLWRGVLTLLEVKDGSKPPSKRKLTPDQVEWHAKWRDCVHVVENVEQAIEAIGG